MERMSTNTEVHALLIAARETISDPARWCQGDAAQDENGNTVFPWGPTAIRVCAATAVFRLHDIHAGEAAKALDTVAQSMGFERGAHGKRPAANLNDTADHLTVLKMFDAAIAATAGGGE